MSLTSVDFPEPETPVTTVNKPERERDVEILQVVGVRAEDLNHFAVGAAALGGNGNFRGTGQITSREGIAVRRQISSGFPLATR